jgi:hypothetical protein
VRPQSYVKLKSMSITPTISTSGGSDSRPFALARGLANYFNDAIKGTDPAELKKLLSNSGLFDFFNALIGNLTDGARKGFLTLLHHAVDAKEKTSGQKAPYLLDERQPMLQF